MSPFGNTLLYLNLKTKIEKFIKIRTKIFKINEIFKYFETQLQFVFIQNIYILTKQN